MIIVSGILWVPELLALMLPALRADLAASEGFRARVEPRLKCPIRICYGVDDRAVSRETLEAWGALTTGGSFMTVSRDWP